MNCFVPFCVNSSESAEITFYKFPSAHENRTAWLRALGKEGCHLPCGATVCSLHFRHEDFRVTKSGVKKLKPGAVPSVMYELELSEQKPVVVSHAELDIQRDINIKSCNLNVATLIKQEPLEHHSDETCCNVYNSHFEVVKHESCDGSYSQQSAAGSLMNSAHTLVSPEGETYTTNTIVTKREVTEQAETSDNGMSENDTVFKGFYCQTTSQYELPASETPNVEHPTLTMHTTVHNFCTNLRNNNTHSRNNVEEKRFVCDICQRVFKHRHALVNHIISHSNTISLNCNFCQYQCKFNSDLSRHMRTHTGDKPFACMLCEYRCTVKASLERHMRTHTGQKPYACTLCEYKCSVKSNLVHHMKTHTREKPFSCNFCPYRCTLKSHLSVHIRTHTREMPFVCQLCQYKCAEKSKLVRHVRTHTGEMPYTCNLCQYKCNQSGNLVRHVRRNHSK